MISGEISDRLLGFAQVRKLAVGAVAVGAAYGVARAHSPKTADKMLDVAKTGLDVGNQVGGSFWDGVAQGVGEPLGGANLGAGSTQSSGGGWGGSGSIEFFLERKVRGLSAGLDSVYSETMRSEGYDSIAMLRQLAADDRDSQGVSDWGRMVEACGIKQGDAVKIKQALLKADRHSSSSR